MNSPNPVSMLIPDEIRKCVGFIAFVQGIVSPKLSARTKLSPMYVQTVATRTDPAATAAIILDVITVIAVLVAIFMPLIMAKIEKGRRLGDKAESDEAAIAQLVNILQQLERVAAALEAMPRMPLQNSIESFRPFVARALSPDVARALSPGQQTLVYNALALSQSQFALSAEYHQTINEGVRKLERERLSADATALEARRLEKRVTLDQERQEKEHDRDTRERLLREIESTQREMEALRASREFLEMKEFFETQEQRRAEIQNIPNVIKGNAASVRRHLQEARASLGDRTEVAAPIPERPLARVSDRDV